MGSKRGQDESHGYRPSHGCEYHLPALVDYAKRIGSQIHCVPDLHPPHGVCLQAGLQSNHSACHKRNRHCLMACRARRDCIRYCADSSIWDQGYPYIRANRFARHSLVSQPVDTSTRLISVY